MSQQRRFVALLLLALLAACGTAPAPETSPAASTLAQASPMAATATPPPASSVEALSTPASAATAVATDTPAPTVTATATDTPIPPATATAPGAPAPAAVETAAAQRSRQLTLIGADGHLQLLQADGALTPVSSQSAIDGSAWSPDGRKIAIVAGSSLFVWDAATQTTTTLPIQPFPTGAPSWSADSQRIAVAATDDPLSSCSVDVPCTIVVGTLDGNVQALGPGMEPHFAPAGTALLAASLEPQAPQNREADWAAPIVWPDLTSPPVTVAEAAGSAARIRATWSADGTLVATSNVLLDNQGQVVEQLAAPDEQPGYAGSVAVADGMTPGGETLALATLTVTRTDEGYDHSTVLSLYDRGSGSRVPIWKQLEDIDSVPPAAGRAPATDRFVGVRRSPAFTGHGRYWRVSPVVWTPDGNHFAFTGCGVALIGDGPRGCGLWLGTAASAGLRLVADTAGAQGEGADAAPRFSADGTQLAFVRSTGGDAIGVAVWVVPADGSAPPQLVARGTDPQWQP